MTFPAIPTSVDWQLATGNGQLAIGFVTPAFAAAGALLISIPILIHILNRRRFKIVNWAAMDFLLKAMRKNRRRIQFEQWLLLALRCCVLLLLGLALARPTGCDRSSVASLAAQRTGLHVFVIDNSYSMAYEAARPEAKTHLDRAKQLAQGMIDRLSSGGESVVVLTAAHPAGAIIAKPAYDLQEARKSIDRIEQSYSGTDLAGVLTKALEIAAEETRQNDKHLYIFTDSTRSAWESPAAQAVKQLGPRLSAAYQNQITHFNLGQMSQWNQAVMAVRPSSNLVTNRFNNDFIAIAKGFGNGPEAILQWKLDEQALPGGTSLRLTTDTPPQTQTQAVLRSGGTHILSATLAGEDRLRIDNTRYRVVDVQSELKVLIVEGERGVGSAAGSGMFLSLAFAPPREGPAGNGNAKSDSYVVPEVISDLELPGRVLSDYRALILTGVGQIQPTQADQIQKFVQQGGTLMLFMGEAVSSENYNKVLLPHKLLPGPLSKRMSVGSDQKGFLFDFKPTGPLHPYLNIFRGEEKSGLDTAQVYTFWQADVAADAAVERVLNYVSGDPAITVHTVGKGRVVFVSTTANADWTSFPAKPNYVTLMHELLAGSINTGDQWMNLTVGQSLEIPPEIKLGATPTLSDSAGKQMVMQPFTLSDGQSSYRSVPLSRPGLYSLGIGTRTIPIAVNVPSDEADIRVLDTAALRKAMGDVPMEFVQDQLPPIEAAGRSGNDFGWAFMLALLLAAATECFLAMRFGHYSRDKGSVIRRETTASARSLNPQP